MLHVEGGSGADSLGAGDGAGLAGVEQADADVRRSVPQGIPQLEERHAGVAEAEIAVLGVPGVVDQQHGLVAARLGLLRALGQIGDGRAHFVGGCGREQPCVLGANASQAGEDRVHALRVALGVPERARSRPALRVADHEREAARFRHGGERNQQRRGAEGTGKGHLTAGA